MKTIKGPAIFLAQFAGDAAPFNTLDAIAGWAAGLGYKGVQIPTWDARLFDLASAANSKAYCDEVNGTLAKHGLALTELSTHLQGQLVAVHPAYDVAFDGFAAPAVRGNPEARQAWAVEQLQLPPRHRAISASRRTPPSPARSPGRTSIPGRSARPAWSKPPSTNSPSAGGRSSTPSTKPAAISATRSIPARTCTTAPPSRCSWSASATTRAATSSTIPATSCCSSSTISHYIDIYHERIKMFHVKDAEFNPTGRQGVYGGFQPWVDRAGRFRSLGDGQVDFAASSPS